MKNPPNNIVVDPIALQAADILERAADLLVREGWRSNDVGEIGEPKCAQGAINVTFCGSTCCPTLTLPKAAVLAFAMLGRTMWMCTPCGSIGDVCRWNNAQSSGKPVIAKMREAAEVLRQVKAEATS